MSHSVSGGLLWRRSQCSEEWQPPDVLMSATVFGKLNSGGIMGIIKSAKVNAIGEAAREAVSEGRKVFACRVNEGVWKSAYSGPMSGVAEQIEAVEAEGWSLDNMAAVVGAKSEGSLILLFRR